MESKKFKSDPGRSALLPMLPWAVASPLSLPWPYRTKYPLLWSYVNAVVGECWVCVYSVNNCNHYFFQVFLVCYVLFCKFTNLIKIIFKSMSEAKNCKRVKLYPKTLTTFLQTQKYVSNATLDKFQEAQVSKFFWGTFGLSFFKLPVAPPPPITLSWKGERAQ